MIGVSLRPRLLRAAAHAMFLAALATPAQAVNLSEDNLGEVLLFPYYTVKNGLDTVVTLFNTSDKTVVAKVRFREALNGREVLTLNIVLSPYDFWNAGVTKLPQGGTVLRTYDNSCTAPRMPDSAVAPGSRELPLSNAHYSGTLNDGESESLERLQEGFFEAYVMGVGSDSTSSSGNVVAYNAKQVNGVPRDCAKVEAAFQDIAGHFSPGPASASGYGAPEAVLKGHVMYINVARGIAFDAEPTAIEHFRSGSHMIHAAADPLPDLTSGDSPARIPTQQGGVYASLDGIQGSENAVSMLLMADGVRNEFATGSGAATSWVVTFPTKQHYTDSPDNPKPSAIDQVGAARPPFKWWFRGDDDGTGKSCVEFAPSHGTPLIVHDRDGTRHELASPAVVTDPPAQPRCLNHAVNVLDFNATRVFGSGVNHVDIAGVAKAGQADLRLYDAQPLNGYTGLPVIGFAAIIRDNNSAAINYGSALTHDLYRK